MTGLRTAWTGFRRRRLRLTAEGRVWLVMIFLAEAVGFYKGMSLLILVGHALLAVIFANGFRMRSRLAAVDLGLNFPEPASSGRQVAAVLTVTNSGSRYFGGMEWRDEFLAQPARGIDAPPGGTELVGLAYLFPFAGVYRLGSATLRSHFPFGLVEGVRPAPVGQEVVVLPRLGSVDLGELGRAVSGAERYHASRGRVPLAAGNQEFRGLKEYRPGDSPRSIHWRSSARRGELLVRDEVPLPARELVLVLELPARVPSPEARERWLALAGTVAHDWLDLPDARVQIWVSAAGRPPTLAAEGGRRQRRDLLAEMVRRSQPGAEPPPPGRPPSERASRVVVAFERPVAGVRPASGPVVRLDPASAPSWYRPPELPAVPEDRT